MLISFIRTIILYFLVVIALRIMGKRQVGQLEPTELVITLMISELASIPMGHVSIPLLHGIIPILTLIFAETILSYIDLKSRKFRKVMSGTPAILIKEGKIIEKELERIRMNLDDLMEELRSSGNMDISNIKYAIFESNGKLSVIPKTSEKYEGVYKGVPFMLICDGIVNEVALKTFQKDEKWLIKTLDSKGINDDISNILFAAVDEKGNFYTQKKGER